MKKKFYFVVFRSSANSILYGYPLEYECICFDSEFALNAWKENVHDFVLSSIISEFTKVINF